MNFAEAALLIQGSTCVYSKKVSVVAPYMEYDELNKPQDYLKFPASVLNSAVN